jgi:hypothetical protein
MSLERFDINYDFKRGDISSEEEKELAYYVKAVISLYRNSPKTIPTKCDFVEKAMLYSNILIHHYMRMQYKCKENVAQLGFFM